jgi:hypothetical protein
MGDKKKDVRAKAGAKGEAKAAAKRDTKRAGKRAAAPLPQSRAELLALHRATRARRNAAAHSSPEHVEAVDLLGRIEIEIARIERAMDPPLV